MPNRPFRTHGPGRMEPYVTTKEVLDYLRTPAAKDYPNMKDCKTTTKKLGEDEDFVQLDPHGLAPTVLASGPAVFHYADKGPDGNLRCINVREAAALQSFPFDYEFLGSQTAMYKQAGNAVPVCFAAAIARTVRGSLRLMHSEELAADEQEETETNENENMVDDELNEMEEMMARLDNDDDDGPSDDDDDDDAGHIVVL